MASYSIEEFVGDGALKAVLPRLAENGWDDVPALKMMNPENMGQLKLTQQQKDALELRSYLHDRSLMEYADRLEASRKPLAELLTLNTMALSSHFGMKRRHVAHFIERRINCGNTALSPCNLPSQERSDSSFTERSLADQNSVNMGKMDNRKSFSRVTSNILSLGQLMDINVEGGYALKGIVAAEPAEARLCGCIQPPPIVGDVAPYTSIENISIQKLTPEYKIGSKCFMTSSSPPLKASCLWSDKPVVLLCVRRPGCIMCRAEAHRLYAKKPVFDSLGFQLIVVFHEYIESELKDFWPRFWGGVVVFDPLMTFFKALGGGDLLKENFLTGFVLNSRAISNYMRSRATGIPHNFVGDGYIKGGLFIIGSGKRGIAYQFVERNFGDWAPVEEVVEVCAHMNELAEKQREMKMERG